MRSNSSGSSGRQLATVVGAEAAALVADAVPLGAVEVAEALEHP